MANNVSIKDYAGATQVLATTENGGIHTPHHTIVDTSGQALSFDAKLDISKGIVADHKTVNKFGRSPDVDDHATDIWDGAIAGNAGDLWVAPTVARQHFIASTSASDDGSPVGVGARTIQVYGLTAWDAVETSEVITLNGTTSVATVASYVIIHRMKVLSWGTSGPNVGVITATAVLDATVTARIAAGEGQTQMAIYGICSTDTAYMTSYYASAIKSATSLAVEMTLLLNTQPDTSPVGFLTKHTVGLATEGSNYVHHCFHPYFKISGPAIIKIKGNSSSASTDVSAGFDLILVDGS
jgi:hypothetical protein